MNINNDNKNLDDYIEIINNQDLIDDKLIQAMEDDEKVKKSVSLSLLFNEYICRKFGPKTNPEQAWNHFKRKKTIGRKKNFYLWTSTIAVAAAVILSLFIMVFPKHNEIVIYKSVSRNSNIIVTSHSSDKEKVAKSHLNNYKSIIKRKTVNVPNGKSYTMTLPDGTDVWINAGSELTYSEPFSDKERVVQLKGEAYFKVKKDKERPFIVESANIKTMALGTEFNINNYNQSKQQITLVQGCVKVDNSYKSIIIHPGEQVSVNNKNLDVNNVIVDDIVCWKDGIIFFDNIIMKDLLYEIANWYNINLICRNSKILNNHLRFEFDRNKDIDDVISTLSNITKCHVEFNKETLYVQ